MFEFNLLKQTHRIQLAVLSHNSSFDPLLLLETLAYHYKKGNRPEKVFEFLVRAGEKAMEFSSMEEAKGYFIEALKVASGHPKSAPFRKREQAVRSYLKNLTAH